MPKVSKVSIKKEMKGKLPSLPFVLLKNKVLGRNYELSIVWATTKTSRNLNKHFRGYDRPTNILSFSLSPKSGELVLHWPTIRRDAPTFGLYPKKFLGYLIIHGLLHLKGMQHSSKMESKERQYSKFFRFN